MSTTTFGIESHSEKTISTRKGMKKLQSLTSNISNATLFGGDNLLNANLVERELDCQICLSQLQDPVLLPCHSHSICLECLKSLFEHQKKEKGANKFIYCPTCGRNSGIDKVKNLAGFKINKELERVRKAYEKERTIWIEEKMKLEVNLNYLTQAQEEANKKKTNKDIKKMDLNGILEKFDMEELNDVHKLVEDIMTIKKKASEASLKGKAKKGKECSKSGPSKNKKEKEEKDIDKENNQISLKTRSRTAGASSLLSNTNTNSNISILLKRKRTMDLDADKKIYTPKDGLKKLKTAQL